MGSCQYIKEDTGNRCNSPYGINYLYYRDAHSMWNGERQVCQNDSQKIFGRLRKEESVIKIRIEKLQSLRKRIWDRDKKDDPQIRELERLVTNELRTEGKLKSVHSPIDLQRQVHQAMQDEVFRRIKKMGKVLSEHRNKFCRLCLHELECKCKQCNHQQNPRHWGDTISSVTLFSQKLYRRDTFNFHVICGRIFIAMFGIDLLPTKSKQTTLLQSIEGLK